MPDVVIRRCTLQVVRRGGWSWGGDTRRLLRSIMDAVPTLVAARLEELLRDVPGDITITEPVRIRLPLRFDELRRLTRPGAATDWASAPDFIARVDGAFTAAARESEIQRQAAIHETEARIVHESRVSLTPARILAEALVAWRETALLHVLIAHTSSKALTAWVRLLASDAAAMPLLRAGTGHEKLIADTSWSSSVPHRPDTQVAALLLDIVERMATTQRASPHEAATSATTPDIPGTATAIVHARPNEPPVPSVPAPALARALPAPPLTTRPSAREPRVRMRTVIVDSEFNVSSGLPWLLLGPLHRLGVLPMLRAALEAAEAEDQGFLFGAALAYKVAGSLDRAWQKSADEDLIAMLMAAQRQTVAKPELHGFGQRVAPHCALPSAQVAHQVSSGRIANDPWLLARVGPDAFALVDPEGLFPAWWGLRGDAIVSALGTSPNVDVIVIDDAPDARVLRRLHEAKVRFLTSSRPGRRESWSRIDHPGWWSNVPGPIAPPTRRRLSASVELVSSARSLATEFGERRLATPLNQDSSFEHALSLVTAAALGTIAWDLWHTRETTDPLMALTRLGDLSARVCFTRTAVRVIVPLGRRHRDLYDAGFLAEVRDVPWLDGRTLEFSGG